MDWAWIMEYLCNDCIFWDDCEKECPVTECEMFVDNYTGPEYYDGDAWREWLNATLGFGTGRRDYEDSDGVRE
jgi:hypothetical protein